MNNFFLNASQVLKFSKLYDQIGSTNQVWIWFTFAEFLLIIILIFLLIENGVMLENLINSKLKENYPKNDTV